MLARLGILRRFTNLVGFFVTLPVCGAEAQHIYIYNVM